MTTEEPFMEYYTTAEYEEIKEPNLIFQTVPNMYDNLFNKTENQGQHGGEEDGK